MPTYTYRCKECQHEYDVFQSIKEELLKQCSQCGSASSLVRLIGAGSGILFKGSGFYVTDYKSKSGDAQKEKSEVAKKDTAKDTGAGKTATNKKHTSATSSETSTSS